MSHSRRLSAALSCCSNEPTFAAASKICCMSSVVYSDGFIFVSPSLKGGRYEYGSGREIGDLCLGLL